MDLFFEGIVTESVTRLDDTPGMGAAWLNGRYENR
jgi:hypothetical protein